MIPGRSGNVPSGLEADMAVMDKATTIATVKTNLNITTTDRDLLIGDIWQNIVNYINWPGVPEELEPFVRAKVKGVIDYEAEFGEGQAVDVASITEGKCSWTYSISGNSSKDAIYGFSNSDFGKLNMFRRLRW